LRACFSQGALHDLQRHRAVMCISGIDRLNPAAILAAFNRYSRRLHIVRPRELSCAGLVFAICFAAFVLPAFAAGQREVESLRVAVYNVPPYAYVDADGSISGVSVDLWRRVAEQMEWHYQLIPISEMESILSGLEQGAPSQSRRKGRRASTFPIRPIGPGSRSP
jgi:Bacterial extracellular solute-binding proteins, family 3